MQSMICDHVVDGPQSITAEQTLVLKATEIAGGTIYAGSPARKLGNTEEKHRQALRFGQQACIDLTEQYLHAFRRID